MRPFITIKELKYLIEKKEITPQESVAFFKKRIEYYNPSLNALIESFDYPEEETLYSHQKSLTGIPGVIKDNLCQKGRVTSCGSRMLATYRAPYDATVVARVLEEGGTILGRTNMDEFAMGSSGEFSAYGASKNPWNDNHVPGGSSSGSAAVVAAGLVPWALGTETGGSVRQPAAFCGLVGLYPTYGLISRFGLVAFTSSTDQPGPLTKTVYDNAFITSIIAGHDPRDSTSLPGPKRDYTKGLDGTVPEDLKIGVLEDVESEGVDPEIYHHFFKAVDDLERMGAKISRVNPASLKHGIAVYFVISRAEAASNLSRFDGTLYGLREVRDDLQDMYKATRNNGFGDEVKRRILLGNYVLSAGHKDAYYTKAHNVRSMIRAEFNNIFKEVDLLISPTTSSLPFTLGNECKDPLTMYLNDYFTVSNCIAGLPALSVPCGYSSHGLPIGFQFMGPRLSESLLYKVAYAYEQATGHYSHVPQNFT